MRELPTTHIEAFANPAAIDAGTIGIVVPCYNEEDGIDSFHRRLVATMDRISPWTVTYVDDGSSDATPRLLELLTQRDARVSVLQLSRNFGKEVATTAGLDYIEGAAVIVIDADLQDPPELITELVEAWRTGADVVYARRRARNGEGWLKRATASGFYKVMQSVGDVKLPPDVGDFRLMSRRAVEALGTIRERHRFMKGLFAWIGFPTVAIEYDRAPRHAGTSKWNYWKLWNLAIEGITSYTVFPLKLATYIGLIVASFSIAYAFIILVRTLVFGNPVAGYPSLIVVVLFLGGLQLITLGILGEYIGRIFNETKQRPLYVVEKYKKADVLH